MKAEPDFTGKEDGAEMTSCVCGTQWHPAPKVRNRAKNHRRKLLTLNGTDRSRTDDLLRVKQALFQLSYDPEKTLTYHFQSPKLHSE